MKKLILPVSINHGDWLLEIGGGYNIEYGEFVVRILGTNNKLNLYKVFGCYLGAQTPKKENINQFILEKINKALLTESNQENILFLQAIQKCIEELKAQNEQLLWSCVI